MAVTKRAGKWKWHVSLILALGGAPRAHLHRKPPSTMGHESLIQRRPSLSHPGWQKYFFQTYNPLLYITIHVDISNCLRKKCTLVDHSKCKCRQIFVDCQGLAEWSGICAFCNNIFGIGLLSWFLIIFKKEDFNYLWSLPIKNVTDFFLISPFT